MESDQMHDWSLLGVMVTWHAGLVQLDVSLKPGEICRVIARDFRKVEVLRYQEWRPSESIMTHVGPDQYKGDLWRLFILMQTGDSIEIIAREIEMPETMNSAR